MTRRMTAEAGISASACAQVTVPPAKTELVPRPFCWLYQSFSAAVVAAKSIQWMQRDYRYFDNGVEIELMVRKRGSTQCMFQTRRAENNTFSAQASFDKLSRPIFARCGGSQGRSPNLIPPCFSRRTLQHHPSLLPPQASAGIRPAR